MSTAKAYFVSFCESNYYRITLTATSEDAAIGQAENLYCKENMDLFQLDTTIGGTDDWQAEEVQS